MIKIPRPKSEEELHKISVDIRNEDFEFFMSNKTYNRSKLIREEVKKLVKRLQKQIEKEQKENENMEQI